MKRQFLLFGVILFGVSAFAQQAPTNTSPTGAGPSGQNSQQFWSRAGNNPSLGSNNIFGTLWNSPIYTQTNAVSRMKLNGTFVSNATQYDIDGYATFGNTNTTVNTSGYLLLGQNAPFQSGGGNIYDRGAYSLLHLNGGAAIQQNGYRPWMKTGVTFTDNQDMAYFGMRQLGSGLDVTEIGVTWSDNSAVLDGIGPDDFVFRFTGGSTASTTILNNDYRNTEDLDGLNIARFTGTGLFALGNTFGANPVGTPFNVFVRPQSLLHMSYDRRNANATDEQYGFMQITYRRPTPLLGDIIGEGETASDGLRFGVDNQVFGAGANPHLNSYLRWQEASSFIIQTENDNNPNIEANERLRVTSIGALNLNYNGTQYFGLNATTDATRISISESGNNPLTRPKSLLHIGYDYGNIGGAGIQGYRRWMDLGVLTSNNRDHVWIGLKPRNGVNVPVTTTVSATQDNLDAVVAWGTDRVATSPTQVDNMRFIFTGHPFDANPEDAPSIQEDGLEMMRMYPATVYQHYIYNASGAIIDSVQAYGRVGVGDFTAMGVNQEPTQKLDVVGNGRFRYLPDSTYIADSLVTKIVMVDESGVLRWKSFVPSEFGTYCADTVNGKLDENKKVVLNNHNLYFTNHPDSMSFDDNKVGVGYDCGTLMPGKLSVYQEFDTTVSQLTIAGHFLNKDISNVLSPIFFTGVYGEASGLQNPNYKTVNRGGAFYARNAQVNFGLEAYATQGDTTYIGFQNIGARVEGSKGASSSGLVAQGRNASSINVGVSGRGTSVNTTISAPSTSENIGGQFIGDYSANNNFGVKGIASYGVNAYGIYGNASSATGINRAGYFVGIVEGTAGGVFTSDSMFKANVNPMGSTLKLLNAMRPSTYTMKSTDFPRFNFDNHTQYGFIAQNLETVFPQLVYQSELPAEYDSTGVEIHPAVPYKSVNYNGIIAINTSAIIELNQKVDRATLSDETIKTNVQDLTGSLDKVLDMHGVSYDWDATVRPDLNLDSSNHVGFIAQEIEAIDPRLTFIGDDSLLHVEYDKVVPILAEAIQELNSTIVSKDSIINNLNDRLSALENCLAGVLPFLCQMNQQAIQANTPQAQEQLRKDIAVTLTNRSTIILDQNVPNPFAEQTVINFSIPETVKKAQIHFYNQEGRIIQTVDVLERGLGSVTVFGADLSSGVYTYTLVADGQIVATKKMMKM